MNSRRGTRDARRDRGNDRLCVEGICNYGGFRMAMRTWHHRELDVWRSSMDLATAIYSLTKRLPNSERFGLVNQMRRAAVSVPSNIAEGAARGSSADFARFLLIARGSVAELETQL